jgi:septal ring factor EnvC (AmiA/AmiB activator)
MAPLLAQIREHKVMMDKRLENLQGIHDDINFLEQRIEEMVALKQDLENQRQTARQMLRTIHRSLPLDH